MKLCISRILFQRWDKKKYVLFEKIRQSVVLMGWSSGLSRNYFAHTIVYIKPINEWHIVVFNVAGVALQNDSALIAAQWFTQIRTKALEENKLH